MQRVNSFSYLPGYWPFYTVIGMENLSTRQLRLQSALQEAGLTQTELAKRVGISQPTLSDLINKENTSSKHLPVIAKLLAVRALWLDRGEGPRYESESDLDQYEAEIIGLFRELPDSLKAVVRAQIQATVNSQQGKK